MGANGSRHYQYSAENLQKKCLQKTRSLSSADQHSASSVGFYPPPILRNLYPELENNPIVVKRLGRSTNPVREHRAETMLVDMVLTNQPLHVQLSAKASSASSSSSGCESSTSDDNCESFQELSISTPLRSRLYAPRLKKMSSIDVHLTRLSVDSGTEFDDENLDLSGSRNSVFETETRDDKQSDLLAVMNAPTIVDCLELGDSSVETLVRDPELCGSSMVAVLETKKKPKKRARSLGKSLRNLRKRAFSLQSISFDENKKKSDEVSATPLSSRRFPKQMRRFSVPLVHVGRSGTQLISNLFTSISGSIEKQLNFGEKPANELFGSNYLDRQWEIVTVKEVCRRLSLDRLENFVLPIPDGATSSQILDESMIRQIMNILPPRAEGYPWVNIYSSEKHGFSLHTLYRKMQEWDEELSPILLLIRDCSDGVFGFIASTALRPSDHYVGTGDSCMLFKFSIDPETNKRELQKYSWTGENQFFVKASKDSLSMGAGGGHFGVWLDADLNKGRSLRCETFDNDPLSDGEDFDVQFLECFGFRMG